VTSDASHSKKIVVRANSLLGNIRIVNLDPHLPPSELAFFTQFLDKKTDYLEYGSGGSTICALDHGVRSVLSVESDPMWFELVSNAISNNDRSRISQLFIDIGPTKEWGWPSSDPPLSTWPNYSLTPWKYSERQGIDPNLVLIDGRFRLACFCASLLFSKPKTTILFDDYTDRPHYHVVEKFIQPRNTVGRLCEFRVPKRLKRSQIKGVVALLSDSLFDPA